MAVTNVAEASAIAIYQTCWQTPDFSDPCCRFQWRPYPRKTELTENSGASLLIWVLVTVGLERPGQNNNWSLGPPSWVYDLWGCTGPGTYEGPMLGLMFAVAILKFFNDFLMWDSTFSFCHEPRKLCSWSCLEFIFLQHAS